MSRLAGLLAALVLALAGAASAAGPLAPGDDGRLSLLSEAPSAPGSPDLATPEAVLAAYRAGAISAPAPLAGYFTAHWFVAEIPDAGAPLAVAIWQALIAQADLWVFEGDRLLDHRRVGVSVDAAGAAPAFAAGFALPVAPVEGGGRTLVLRVEPLLFLGTDVELSTEARVRRVATLRSMLFPAVLGLFLGVAVLHLVLGLRFGDWRNGLFAGVLAITFCDWFLWLGGPQALGVVTSRDAGFAIVAASTYAHTFALSLLYACIFADPLRRRRKAIATLSAVFAAYVVYPLFPEADAGKHLIATLALTLTQVAVIAAMAGPALAARAPGTRCALTGSVVKVFQSAIAFAPMAIPGMEAVNTALTVGIGHFDSGAIVIALIGFAMMSLSLWDRHRAAIRSREIAAREARLEAVRVAQICHDIRSPLHAVQSLLTALDLDDVRRDRRSDLAEACGVLGSVRDLVEDIVAAARADDRRNAPVALAALARRVAAAARETCRRRGVPVRVRIAPTAPETVRGDPVALERVLGNLVANAARACRQGPLEIVVERGPADAAARLLVRDDGPGMPTAARARLLGEAEAGAPVAEDGAMGLTVVRSLAAALGARLDVASPAEGGTLVTVDLPAASREPVVQPALAGLRLLVVEDDPVTASAMVSILRAEGHRVATADDGARGLALATTGGFDAALVDLDLGQDAGCDLIKAIRRLPDPVRAGLPVIVVSGHPDTVRMARACGAQGALPKPFDRATLRAALAPINPGPSASPPPATEADQLDELADALSPEGFRELVESAEAQIRACAETVLRADADRAAAGKAAHRLGGAAAIVGFAELSAAARAFEAAARTGADLASQRQVVGSRIDEALTRLGALRLPSVGVEAPTEETI